MGIYLFSLFGLLCVKGHSLGLDSNKIGQCTYKGQVYNDGEIIPSDPCQPRKCISGYVPLAFVDCINPQCVDFVIKSGECCATCPTGMNCRLPNGTLMPGKEIRIMPDGKTCRCVHTFGFGKEPHNPDALCTFLDRQISM
ncbi:hypothetical protein LOTGIDRAFT_174498 [Lottia gigantea]|uniref:VWFC domain-containing protein n=1 Tax=Lottia gigantea TaxID=225164 RepID=V4C6D2_LOTGI|nr:hypothetical protein LOTGIDRAFT_174498 [Lottia gigantea]ESO97214.1 hypothetical protein LOTGIDRAFT_174498 [Lottia gigantea]